MIVSNSSPLIYLAKINKLSLLKILFTKIIIPKEVYDEVVIKGKENKYLEAIKIENAVEENWIQVKEIKIDKEIEKSAPEIDLGEISVINLARKLNPELLLIDDAPARIIAESFGFNVKGTIYVLLKSFREKIITKQETKDLLKILIFEGFRISSEFYARILEDLEGNKYE